MDSLGEAATIEIVLVDDVAGAVRTKQLRTIARDKAADDNKCSVETKPAEKTHRRYCVVARFENVVEYDDIGLTHQNEVHGLQQCRTGTDRTMLAEQDTQRGRQPPGILLCVVDDDDVP